MLAKQRRTDAFAQFMIGGALPAEQESVGEEAAGEGEEAEQEYVSPFRDQQAVAAAQQRRLARYPTTSASSAYAMAKPEELGYRKIKPEERRAKDIQFPTYLQENEKRQLVLLKELEMKENHLQYLKDSQRVYTEEELEAKAEEPVEGQVEEPAEEPVEGQVEEPVEEAVVEEKAVEPVEEQTEEPAEGSAAQESAPAVEAVEKITETPEVETPQDVPEQTAETTPVEVSEQEVVPEPATPAQPAEAVVDDTVKSKSLADPLKVPMVMIPPEDHRTFFTKFFKSAPPPIPNPEASPENPEEVVKTADGNYLTKAVYDKVSAQNQEHKQWIADYVQQEKEKYDDKRANSNRKINSLRNEIKQIKESMEQLRKDTDAKVDVKENELTRKLLQLTGVHVRDKNKVFKETELLKKQKISEKDTVVDKQTEVQKEIDELNVQKSEVQAEYIQWSNNLADLSAHIDAKVAKLADIDRKQAKTAGEIDTLEKEKQSLLSEAEQHNAKHVENAKVIEDAENKTYLPRINEIDGKISVLLTQLTSVKQQCANERTELSAITKKLEEERIAHEEKLKLEAEERQRKEEDLLGKQREELEAKAQEARLKHEEEMRKLKEDYTELESKFKKEQQQKKDAIAFANHPKNTSRNSSLFEYITEEEILSA